MHPTDFNFVRFQPSNAIKQILLLLVLQQQYSTILKRVATMIRNTFGDMRMACLLKQSLLIGRFYRNNSDSMTSSDDVPEKRVFLSVSRKEMM